MFNGSPDHSTQFSKYFGAYFVQESAWCCDFVMDNCVIVHAIAGFKSIENVGYGQYLIVTESVVYLCLTRKQLSN